MGRTEGVKMNLSIPNKQGWYALGIPGCVNVLFNPIAKMIDTCVIAFSTACIWIRGNAD